MKFGVDESVRDLGDSSFADWLGYHIGWDGGRLVVTVGEKGWDRLDDNLRAAHGLLNASLRAREIIREWLNEIGPCYRDMTTESVTRRVHDFAHAQVFDEIFTGEEMRNAWQLAYSRWRKVSKSSGA